MVATQETIKSQTAEPSQQPLPDWYDRWRERIQAWVSDRVDRRIAWIVLLVPDMFALIVRLLRDDSVSRRTKFTLLLSLGYVLLPFDFLPEMLLGVLGLVDDASMMGLSLFGLRAIGAIDPKILRDHWSGNGDIITVINRLHEVLGVNFFGVVTSWVWKQFKAKFRAIS